MFTEASPHSEPYSSTSNASREPSRVPLSELADAACLAAEGDTADGAARLLHILETQYPIFNRAKIRESMSLWAQEQMRHARSRLRSDLASPPLRGYQPVPHQAVGSASLRSAAASWFNWPVSGVMLGNATRAHLQSQSHAYLRDADTFAKRGRWLEAIALAMPDDTTKVSDVMDEDVIGKMAADFGVSV